MEYGMEWLGYTTENFFIIKGLGWFAGRRSLRQCCVQSRDTLDDAGAAQMRGTSGS